MQKDIRWKQRFDNLERAVLFLEQGIDQKKYDKLQAVGLIKSFELAFELSWKTLKDFLEEMGTPTRFPREVIKLAFQNDLIEDGSLWINMLDHRNEWTHTYDEQQANHAVNIIRTDYFPGVKQVYTTLKKVS